MKNNLWYLVLLFFFSFSFSSPVIPGGAGVALKTVRVADKVTDAVKTGDKVAGKKFYRYVGNKEAEIIKKDGKIPNVDADGLPR